MEYIIYAIHIITFSPQNNGSSVNMIRSGGQLHAEAGPSRLVA
jgi:hypothetical protein